MNTNKVAQPDLVGQQGVSLNSLEDPTIHDALASADGAAFKFLSFIFEGISNGFVEFRYFGPGPKPKVVDRSTYYPLPLDAGLVAKEVLTRNGQQMLTVGPAPRCRIPSKGQEGKDKDILQVGCIWADLDNKHVKGGTFEVIERVKDLPLRPSVVVNSGYGRHVYYIFHAPLRDSRLLEWREMISGLRTALNGDAVINLSRVMRLPGTLNIKEALPLLCEICEEDSSWLRYSVDEVKQAIREASENSNSNLGYSSSKVIPSMPHAGFGPIITFTPGTLRQRGVPADIVDAIVTGRRTLRTGSNAGSDNDSSGRDFLIACTLLEKGFKEEEIKVVFRANPHGCGSKWALPKHGEKYLSLTLEKAISRYREKKSYFPRAASDEKGAREEGVGLLDRGLPSCYRLSNDGSLWFDPPVMDEDKKLSKSVKVSNSILRISEIQENVDTGLISVVITYEYLGRPRATTILRSQMSDARQLVAALSGEGAPVTSNNARLIISYLASYEHAFADSIHRKKVTSRFGRGRAGGPFYLPGLSSDIEFSPSGPGDSALYRAYSSRRGSLQSWADLMQAVAGETLMIPQVAILSAFVPPLQSRLQIPNFILDVNGNTSTGKSTSLKLAASIYGKPNDPDSLVMQWMNTRVAVEQVAGMCSELPVFLDDAQHCPDELKRSVVYMIANGRGKGRGARGGGIRETLTWHTVALSTSEEPLHESSPHEGARGRILPVGGATPPFHPGMGSFVQSLERAIATNHGYAGEVYIRHLNGLADSDWAALQRRYSIIRTELLKNSSSDLVGRVSGYIAAIQLAAEVACPLLGLGFKPDVVGAWLMLHLDEQQRDQNQVLLALRALADFYISNLSHFAGDGNYNSEKPNTIYGSSKRDSYVGFLRSTIDTVFKARKWNQTAILNKMAEASVLHATEGDRHTKKVTVEGVTQRMVCIKWSAILPEDVYASDVQTSEDSNLSTDWQY